MEQTENQWDILEHWYFVYLQYAGGFVEQNPNGNKRISILYIPLFHLFL